MLGTYAKNSACFLNYCRRGVQSKSIAHQRLSNVFLSQTTKWPKESGFYTFQRAEPTELPLQKLRNVLRTTAKDSAPIWFLSSEQTSGRSDCVDNQGVHHDISWCIMIYHDVCSMLLTPENSNRSPGRVATARISPNASLECVDSSSGRMTRDRRRYLQCVVLSSTTRLPQSRF